MREGVYFGFQGELNLVGTENLSSEVFRPYLRFSKEKFSESSNSPFSNDGSVFTSKHDFSHACLNITIKCTCPGIDRLVELESLFVKLGVGSSSD